MYYFIDRYLQLGYCLCLPSHWLRVVDVTRIQRPAKRREEDWLINAVHGCSRGRRRWSGTVQQACNATTFKVPRNGRINTRGNDCSCQIEMGLCWSPERKCSLVSVQLFISHGLVMQARGDADGGWISIPIQHLCPKNRAFLHRIVIVAANCNHHGIKSRREPLNVSTTNHNFTSKSLQHDTLQPIETREKKRQGPHLWLERRRRDIGASPTPQGTQQMIKYLISSAVWRRVIFFSPLCTAPDASLQQCLFSELQVVVVFLFAVVVALNCMHRSLCIRDFSCTSQYLPEPGGLNDRARGAQFIEIQIIFSSHQILKSNSIFVGWRFALVFVDVVPFFCLMLCFSLTALHSGSNLLKHAFFYLQYINAIFEGQCLFTYKSN